MGQAYQTVGEIITSTFSPQLAAYHPSFCASAERLRLSR